VSSLTSTCRAREPRRPLANRGLRAAKANGELDEPTTAVLPVERIG